MSLGGTGSTSSFAGAGGGWIGAGTGLGVGTVFVMLGVFPSSNDTDIVVTSEPAGVAGLALNRSTSNAACTSALPTITRCLLRDCKGKSAREIARCAQYERREHSDQSSRKQKQLAARTVYRPGELLEVTPGLTVSQHSGERKANQLYLRRFNLDPGADLRTTVDGMIVNQRSHAQRQDCTDLNFLIPELAERLDYNEGRYSADEGGFASAGAVSVRHSPT